MSGLIFSNDAASMDFPSYNLIIFNYTVFWMLVMNFKMSKNLFKILIVISSFYLYLTNSNIRS